MLSAKTKSEVFGKRSSKRTLLGNLLASTNSLDEETASASAATFDSQKSTLGPVNNIHDSSN
jgi:hypothetical protein